METLLTSSRVCLPACMQHCHVKLSTYYWISLKSNLFLRDQLVSKFFFHTPTSLSFFPIQVGDKEGRKRRQENWKQQNWNPIQFKAFGHCHSITHPFLTRPEPNKAHPSTGQSSPDLTHCKAYQPFATFLPPQGTLGHSWQEAQIGFKASLFRLKKWAIQPRTDGILCSVLLLPLPSPLISNPSHALPLLLWCKASQSPSGKGHASVHILEAPWGQVNPWRELTVLWRYLEKDL